MKLTTVLHFGDSDAPKCETVKTITSKTLAGANVTIRICVRCQQKTQIITLDFFEGIILSLILHRKVNVTIGCFVLAGHTNPNHNVSACAANRRYDFDSSMFWGIGSFKVARVLRFAASDS